METGKVGVQISKETGGAYVGPREVIEDELTRIKSAPIAVERSRLEREVIEKCSAYCKGVLEVEQHGYPKDVSVNEWHVQHCERQTAMINAYKALESFEAEQKK